MLSMKTRYAIKALIGLATKDTREPVLIQTLAEEQNIPKKFLELILLDLKAMGILSSKKGKHGGYFLRVEPARIRIGQVVRGMEGPLALLQCVSQTQYERCEDCPDERICGLRLVFKDVRDATSKILDNTTLADVLARIEQEQAQPEVMFHI
ncbi:MAG TPA: Rrf2 family transcriptional regulator [Planctomycetota bacterium]|nr:Rrf2 family transcriptional regulator [Planctomycetota bacterium]